ncbi:MAG: DUF3098 domain-containing protein [Muribaculaceae bacterium]|nr:DUF3098 domain-containing protein [Muribaculaceae bacterium]MDE6645036.1 DUF3098 domain-containing protein [Muribaculaceae bacterium]
MATKKNNTSTVNSGKNSRVEIEKPSEFPLMKLNFKLMGIAALTIIVGFLLMLGPGATEEAFNPDIFSTRRVVVGPTIAFLGFLFMGFAIIYRPKTEK